MSNPTPPKPSGASTRDNEFGDLRAGTMRGKTFVVVRAILTGLLKLLVGYSVQGEKNVPREGPLIVISNHLHNGDPLAVAVAVPRPIHYMAKRELFEVPVLGWIIRRGGTFPVDRGAADRKAIRRADATLAQGIALGMFPEGTRSTSGAIKKPLPGAAMIALRSGAPILPVAVTGTERLPFNGKKGATRRFKRGIEVVIGRPFTICREENGKRVTSEEATDRMMRVIAGMLPEEYRGIYADTAIEDVSAPDSGVRPVTPHQ